MSNTLLIIILACISVLLIELASIRVKVDSMKDELEMLSAIVKEMEEEDG